MPRPLVPQEEDWSALVASQQTRYHVRGVHSFLCPKRKTAEAAMAERLSRLEAIEADIMRVMQNAQETCEELQKMHQGDRSRLVNLSREYLELVEVSTGTRPWSRWC